MWTVTHTGNANTYDVEYNGTFMVNVKWLSDADNYIIEQEELLNG